MTRPSGDPWQVHFFQRHRADDANRSVPAVDFFDGLSTKLVARFKAVLDAVAEAPPPRFGGGGYWEAMHGEMAGFYEVRILGPDRSLHRLFCRLENPGDDLGGPSIVCIAGMSKRPGKKFTTAEYGRVRQLGAEFKRRRTVAS